MATIEVLSADKVKVGEVELHDSVFNAPMKEHAVYETVCAQLASRRKGAASSLGRSEVKGGGKKPWRQKGTGHARAGTSRSPLWRGGGVAFGPKPRDYSYTVPKKMRKAALRTVLTSKIQEAELVVIDRLEFDKPSTKKMAAMLQRLIGEGHSVAIALGDWTKTAWLSGRNIPGVRVLHAERLNVYTTLQHEFLIVDQAGLSIIEGALVK